MSFLMMQISACVKSACCYFWLYIYIKKKLEPAYINLILYTTECKPMGRICSESYGNAFHIFWLLLAILSISQFYFFIASDISAFVNDRYIKNTI